MWMSDTYQHSRTSRNASSYATVGVAVVVLLALMFWFEAHPFIVAVFGVMISPAIWTIISNTKATLTVDDTAMSWQVGARGDEVPLEDIDYVRTRTSFDLSQRVTVFRHSGPRRHVPGPCNPSGRALDAALEARGITVKRLF